MFNIVERNREDYAHAESPLIPMALNVLTFQREMHSGALVLDTRSPHQFAEGHIPGALDVSLHGSAFATRVGFIALPDSRLLLVINVGPDLSRPSLVVNVGADLSRPAPMYRPEGDLHEAVRQLAVVGFDQVVGYLDGGMPAWTEAELPVQQLQQLTVEELHTIHSDLAVLDVRDQNEWDEGHIKGALHIPYYFIEQHLQDEHDELNSYRDRPLAVTCASGQRSTIACSLLQRHNFRELFNVVGGMEAWEKAGFTKTLHSL